MKQGFLCVHKDKRSLKYPYNNREINKKIISLIHPRLLVLMFYVYVLKSSRDGQLYIGYTKDLKQRLKKHNSRKVASTAKRIPLSLVYYEAFKSQQDATKREQNLKEFKSAYGQLKKRLALSLA